VEVSRRRGRDTVIQKEKQGEENDRVTGLEEGPRKESKIRERRGPVRKWVLKIRERCRHNNPWTEAKARSNLGGEKVFLKETTNGWEGKAHIRQGR